MNPKMEKESKRLKTLDEQMQKYVESEPKSKDNEHGKDCPIYKDESHTHVGRRGRGSMDKRQTSTTSRIPKRRRVIKPSSSGHMMFENREFDLLEYTDYLQAQMEVEAHFNKKFVFSKPGGESSSAWRLPPADNMYTQDLWENAELQITKASLNKVKEQLGSKDISTWHEHTKFTNPSDRIAYEFKRKFNAEMITQAWLKFYEIVNAYPIVPLGSDVSGDATKVEDATRSDDTNTADVGRVTKHVVINAAIDDATKGDVINDAAKGVEGTSGSADDAGDATNGDTTSVDTTDATNGVNATGDATNGVNENSNRTTDDDVPGGITNQTTDDDDAPGEITNDVTGDTTNVVEDTGNATSGDVLGDAPASASDDAGDATLVTGDKPSDTGDAPLVTGDAPNGGDVASVGVTGAAANIVKQPIKRIPFNSVHLCEAPGAFITSLNHYLAIHRPEFKWQFLANTVNPYYEGAAAEACVVVDKLIHHTLHNWTFGANNTGDLMEKENLDDLICKAEQLGPIQLVTADGSVDCQASPGEQELDTHKLHLCEAVAAMSILSPGGNFVIKKFTMFESETVNLMYLLCCVFREVKVFKPGTSKEGNSEVYVVCLDYSGKEACYDHLQKLHGVYGVFCEDKAMFGVKDLPTDYLKQIKKCAEIFKAYQVKTITKNLSLEGKMTDRDRQYVELIKHKSKEMFFKRNYCTHIKKKQMLTEDKVNKSRYLLESDLVKPVTSMFVRENYPHEKLNFSWKCLNSYIDQFSSRHWIIEIAKSDSFYSYKFPSFDLDNIEFDVIRGQPYTRIKNSKFCSPKVLECFRALYILWNENCNESSSLSLDDSLIQFVLKEYPEAPVLSTKLTPDPTYDLGALLEALHLIRDQKLNPGDSLILLNVTLLSRLQCGLLMLLNSAFSSVVVYTSPQFGSKTPLILLENFRSEGKGKALISVVHSTGWNPFDGNPDLTARVLQLVSYPQIASNLNLCSLYYYNLHHCFHRSIRLHNSLQNILK